MDALTQALLGAAVAEAGFRRRLGRGALALGALCGVAPDLDALSAVGGFWVSLAHHRGLSHSLLTLTVLAPAVGVLASRALGEGEDARAWTALAWAALISHPLLDLFTSFGTQLFAPLSSERFSLDGVAAVDPAVTLPLAVALWRGRRWGPRVALLWVGLYCALGWGLSQRAVYAQREALAQRGFAPVAQRALLAPGLPLLRRVVARDARGRLAVGLWSPTLGVQRLSVLEASPGAEAALSSEAGRALAWFADGYVHAQPAGPGAWRLSDQRFGRVSDPQRGSFFQVELRLSPEGEVTSAPLPTALSGAAEEWRLGWRLSLGAAAVAPQR